MLFGEIIPVEYFGMDASIFGAIVGGMFGGMLIGLLSNFFVVPLFSYMYWGGLILNPNEYFSKRDFCILRHVEISSVGDIEIVQRSVDNVRCPRTLVHVRGEVYGGGFYITRRVGTYGQDRRLSTLLMQISMEIFLEFN